MLGVRIQELRRQYWASEYKNYDGSCCCIAQVFCTIMRTVIISISHVQRTAVSIIAVASRGAGSSSERRNFSTQGSKAVAYTVYSSSTSIISIISRTREFRALVRTLLACIWQALYARVSSSKGMIQALPLYLVYYCTILLYCCSPAVVYEHE